MRTISVLAAAVTLLAACAADRAPGPPASAASIATDAPRVSVAPAPAGSTAIPSRTPGIPPFDHIYLIVMENHEFGSIVGSPAAPYLNSLVDRYALATDYHAVAHPSQPNYLAIWAGSTFGIRDDGSHDLTARTVADQVEAAGRTWHVYAQGLPRECATVAIADAGVDLVGAAGTYARKHEPAISFTSVSGDRARCARITRLETFSASAADLELIVPNQTNDMHDGTIGQGDAFLRAFVPRIVDSPGFGNSLLVITFDEGTTSAGGGGRVATVIVSPKVRPGARSDRPHDHYSLLRTIQDAWGLGCLERSCDANDLGDLFGP